MPRHRAETLGEIREYRIFPQPVRIQPEEILHQILEEILLLPAVERRVKGRHEMKILGRLCVKQAVHLLEGGAIKRQALRKYIGQAYQETKRIFL